MKVILAPDVRLYLQELEHNLYFKHYFFKHYFGSEESSHDYVDAIFYFIEFELPYSTRKSAPRHYDRYGSDLLYVTFRKNKHTHWYVFFDLYEDGDGEIVFLIRYIGNNHSDAQHIQIP